MENNVYNDWMQIPYWVIRNLCENGNCYCKLSCDDVHHLNYLFWESVEYDYDKNIATCNNVECRNKVKEMFVDEYNRKEKKHQQVLKNKSNRSRMRELGII